MGKRKCANPGWNHIQVETGDFTFGNSPWGPSASGSITFTHPFHPDHRPLITLFHSGSLAEEDSHVNIYLAEVTQVGFVVSASNPNYSSIHYQAIAMW